MQSDASTRRPWPRCKIRHALPASVTLLLLTTFWHLHDDTLLWRELQNTGHSVVFGILTVLVLCSYQSFVTEPARHPLRGYLLTGIVCLLGGGAVEVIQFFTGRDADVLDVVRDMAGILAALALCAAFDPRLVRPGTGWRGMLRRIVLLACAAALVVAGSYALVRLSCAYQQRARAFPVIADPAADWTAAFLAFSHASLERIDDPAACAASGSERLAQLRLEPVRYAGFSIIEPQPDWRAYSRLLLTLTSARSAPLELDLRIDDALHNQEYTDRFNRTLLLQPGVNRVSIPLSEIRDAPAGRRMDMAHITGITLFITRATERVVFCTGPLRLE